jgi:dTDP-4-amino-4,6-dideoxygalactose transaminase
MIPRLKPFLGSEEFTALFKQPAEAVRKFEEAFCQTFDVKHALTFPYGRSALWAFFKSLDFQDAEIVQPAYTCSVVAHATVLSGNKPVFVDNTLTDYNMQLESFEKAITARTRAVIPTHLFGYAMDSERVNKIVKKAEKRFGQRIYIIEDCAHSFDAAWQGRPVIQAGDGALFGLGISKQITSIFGGMFTTDDKDIAERLRAWRNNNFKPGDWVKSLRRALYLMAVYPAFNETLYGLVWWLQEKTPILNRLTKAYHLDEAIHFPPDFDTQMCSAEAGVGLAQLAKYAAVKERRKEIAAYYFDHISAPSEWIMPPQRQDATYSHFVIRVPNRDEVLAFFASRGVQLGQLIEYSIPHLPAYGQYTDKDDFPNSLFCSQHMINLPIHPGLKPSQLDKVIAVIKAYKAGQ